MFYHSQHCFKGGPKAKWLMLETFNLCESKCISCAYRRDNRTLCVKSVRSGQSNNLSFVTRFQIIHRNAWEIHQMFLLWHWGYFKTPFSCPSHLFYSSLFEESTTFSSTNTRHKTKTKRLGHSALKGLNNHHFDGTTFNTYGASYEEYGAEIGARSLQWMQTDYWTLQQSL